jgi:crotonobetainyl-CoA:carnitine CoA-transferase CaiB-like acyl-CoA transferase
MKQPLEGIKILDLSRYLPGPFATQFLADFGAEVIKIEEPGGELGRALPPFAGGMGTRFASVNRNKKSITLDLKKDETRKIFMKLAEGADVVVDQFRPGVMDKLGLGYESLKKVNKGIIYCSITGYGLSGPWMKAAGHDVNYLNISGVSGLTAGRDCAPVMSSVQIADVAGGSLYAVIGILLALFARTRTGEGQLCDIAMMDGALSLLSYTIGEWAGNGRCPAPGREFLTGGFAMYNVYRCSDNRYVSLGAIEQKFWQGFCEGIGRVEFVPLQYNIEKQEDLIAEISAIILTKTRDEWTEHFRNRDICFTPVLDLDEVSEHEQVRAREMMLKVVNFMGSGAEIHVTGNPVKLSGTPCDIGLKFPQTGEDTENVLREAGYTVEEIKRFKESGVV